MSEDADAPKLPLPELHPESLVCRLARNARWINSEDQRRLIPEAFLRRRTESGLSVNIEGACDVDFIEKMRHDTPPLKAHGKADLGVGPIRDLPFPLDVIPDSQTHADIVGMPAEEDDPKLARDIAHALADLATVTWIRPKQGQG